MKFIVVSPRENPKSAGSMFLFQLAESIENLGYEANRILIAQNDQGHFFISVDQENFIPLQTDTLEQFFDPLNTIIIHGENLHHKYFDSFSVARFYLNRIGALRNVGVPRDGEYKIAWSEAFVENPDFTLQKPLIKQPKEEILRLDEPRLLDLTYIGKGSLYDPRFSRLQGTIELTRIWPDNIDEYLLLLSKTRFLFTFDGQTSVITEAIFYGAMPVIMTCEPRRTMGELFDTYDKEVADCCLVFEEFKNITDENFDKFVSDFFRKRKKFLSYVDQKLRDYPNSLEKLLTSIQERFNPIALKSKNKMN